MFPSNAAIVSQAATNAVVIVRLNMVEAPPRAWETAAIYCQVSRSWDVGAVGMRTV